MTSELNSHNPYPGPRPFAPDEHSLFFGRDDEVAELFSLITAHRVVLLYAQSGAGKTSVLNAGLIPLLTTESFEVLPVARVRGLIPEDIDLGEIPNVYVFNTLMGWVEDSTNPRSLISVSLNAFLNAREHLIDTQELPSPRVVIFDQFEELFTSYPERWKEREEFFVQVAEALERDPLLRVLFAIREDYLANLDPYVDLLPERLRTRFRLERLRDEAACLAVEGPLQDTGRSFADGVTSSLVQELLKIRVESATGEMVEVAGEFVEPVQLQIVCQNLWRELPPDSMIITADHLQTFGDVDEALKEFYERAVKMAARKIGIWAKEGDLRTWFDRKLITAAGTRGIVFRGREDTEGIPNAAIDELENQHLIRAELRAGSRWYELTHDRFIGPIRESNQERRGKTVKRLWWSVVAMVLVTLVGWVGITWRVGQWEQHAIERSTLELGTDRPDEAVAALRREVEITPDHGSAWYNLGIALARQGKLNEAVAAYRRQVGITPDHGNAWNNLGVALARQDELDEAVAAFQQQVRVTPDHRQAWNNLGVALRDQGKLDEAAAAFQQQVRVTPDHRQAWYNLGDALRDQGKLDEAVAAYRRQVGITPDHGSAWNNLGDALRDQGKLEEAAAAYRRQRSKGAKP
jgi:tetratricopeptide (TPR) repeat protein